MAADSKAKYLQDAEKYMLHGKVQQAIGEYQKIIKSDPNDVLILNTIGDLYLRQGNSSEANRCFSQVAENYVRNNFFLKAIAVYKKILNTDPDNLEVNATVASLCAKQGLNIEARNQYLKIAAIYEKEGRTQETAGIYEKIVELDPSNAAIQRKLAELHLAQKSEDKARVYFAGAARAQLKAAQFAGAADSFRHALQINPLDLESMKGFLECGVAMKDVAPALDQLKKSTEMAPDNLDLREMLGRAYLADKQPEGAILAFQRVVAADESRYSTFFDVAQGFIDAGEYDRAASCLDPIVSILITRRETDRAVQLYEQILQRQPSHIASMIKLASVFYAIDNQGRYLKTLDSIAAWFLSEKRPVEALEYLTKIVQADPESLKYQELHRKTFEEAYPDTPYTPPEIPSERTGSVSAGSEEAAGKGDQSSVIVEIDLLLNYGMKDKAMGLLQNLETSDPANRDMRVRLLSIFKEEGKTRQAAEQCLLLVVLCRRSMDEESAQRYWSEAQELDPDLVHGEPDLDAFARRRGIVLESLGASSMAGGLSSSSEVDLSGDLLDIFFSGNQEIAAGDESGPMAMPETIAESYSRDISEQAPSKSVQEQLQEVDFYIRLGFNDEALSKLNEIAKLDPNNPELAPRYQRLGDGSQVPIAPPNPAPVEAAVAHVPGPVMPEGLADLPEFEIDEVLNRLGDNAPELLSSKQAPASPQDLKPAKSPFQFNEMFSDLLEEVSSISDQEIAKETFENHFGLGTAYREMDLVDEAIKEFQIALRALDSENETQKLVQCCGMLSTCYIKKGMPKSVLRWCQTGLSVPDLSSHEALALRYDMGLAHLMSGSNNQALDCFDEIFAEDPGYRDVAQRIDELKGGFKQNAP